MRKVLIPYLLIGLLAVSVQAGSFQFTYQKNINIGDHPKLILKNKIGSVEIEAAPIGDIEVSATKNIKAADQVEAERMAEYIEISVTKSGDHLTLETLYHENLEGKQSFWDRLLGRGKDIWGSVAFKISVPYNCAVNVDNPKGGITVLGVENEVYAVNSEGDMKFTRIKGPVFIETLAAKLTLTEIIGDINIISSGSEIDFTAITGRIEVKSTSGSITARDIDGPVGISSTSGPIDVSELLGDIKIEATSGSIKIAQELGGIDITTHNGDVEIKSSLDSDRGYFVSTRKGSIIFNVPESASGSV
jgi:hypothetical protein